ncbi:hypothetical protein [Riemerella columbina]|uniref:hypothetical protein n=1 Tax=Riemerella columbina TaxID=103810 RepID=UPI000366A8A5|nr:hypothetical protein [Riemerella columbina]
MKKLFFPIVMVVGLTAMSFTSVKAETKEVKEVSMDEFMKIDSEGKSIATKRLCLDVFTEHIYNNSIDMEISSKMDNILSNY